MPLDKSSPLPLYHQLKEALAKLIEDKYAPGDLLPTESEIERMFDVSRMTVRLAMSALVEEGLVVRQQGRGTFVQAPKITHSLRSITSWTEQMQERGLKPATASCDVRRFEPPRKIRAMLELADDETVLRVKRVRYASDEPMSIMINYLREKYVPGLAEAGLRTESLYETLERTYGIRIAQALETVEAREATEDEAEQLRIAPYAPVLFVTRLSRLADGAPVELVHLTNRADRYQYQTTLTSTPPG